MVGDFVGQKIIGSGTFNWGEFIGSGVGGYAGSAMGAGLTIAALENGMPAWGANILGNGAAALPAIIGPTFGGYLNDHKMGTEDSKDCHCKGQNQPLQITINRHQ